MTGRTRSARLLAAVLLATAVAGCAGKPRITPAIPPEELYARAEREMDRKRWDLAAEEFKKLADGYPYHELTAHAELRLGDMYFLDRKYQEAAASYEQFLKLRPSHQLAPYAMYLLGSSYFHQRVSFDRDPTLTRKAADVFARLLEQHGSSDHAGPARARLNEARGELAAHEMYVGDFYLRQKRCEAALRRFTKVWTGFPEQPTADKARVRAGECQLKLARPDAARATLSTVLHRTSDRDLARRAETLLKAAGLEPLPTSAMAPVPGAAEVRSRAVAR